MQLSYMSQPDILTFGGGKGQLSIRALYDQDHLTIGAGPSHHDVTVVSNLFLLTLNPSNVEATFGQSTRTQDFRKTFKPFHICFYGIALAENLRWVPTCHGFSHFSVFLHHFVLAKIATSSRRVNRAYGFDVDVDFIIVCTRLDASKTAPYL